MGVDAGGRRREETAPRAPPPACPQPPSPPPAYRLTTMLGEHTRYLFRRAVALGCAAAVTLACAGGSSAQSTAAPPRPGALPRPLSLNPDDPASKAYAQAQRARVALERELRQIRFKYFRSTRKTEVRQVGIALLREYTDPSVFPALLDLFSTEGRDVRAAVLDHLVDRESPEGDATLAWGALFDADEWFRTEARTRLLARATAAGGAPSAVQQVIAEGLRRERDAEVGRAAVLAADLDLLDAIPMLIAAQTTQRGGDRSGDGSTGSLASIIIGQQTAFVADLTPVVSDSAVAFDPTIAVVTEGVVLSVGDAAVTTYRTIVHESLVRLSSKGWGGRSTKGLGYDPGAWRRWYADEFLPYRREVESQTTVGKTGGPSGGPSVPKAPPLDGSKTR